MRSTFIRTLAEAAAADPRVTLVVGDLGFGVVVDFARRFPEQFLNAGVAEQNMTGIAAGMALAGKVVFTYSIANFPVIRCLEQIRNDVCYHKANVVVVAVGGGYSYGSLGMTHHATEDLALMRALPEMTVLAPGDPVETAAATKAVAAGIGPVYLRLGRDKEPIVHQQPISWSIGKALTVREGNDLTLISTGAMLATAVAVAEMLAERGIHARVLSMHTLKPLDVDAVLAAARETGKIVTIEEHSIIGGLGGGVAEVLCEAGLPNVRFHRIGLPLQFIKAVGDQEYLRKLLGLDPTSIMEQLRIFFPGLPWV
ncbi:MAG: transketolase [Pirellulales bacterium]|nr:transketolase [Pirellulales bacterium]